MKNDDDLMGHWQGVVETRFAYCPVCGIHGVFRSYAPQEFPCKRNDFICQHCTSVGRNRHVAIAVLDIFKTRTSAASLTDFALNFEGALYITCVKEAVYEAVKTGKNVVSSEYVDGVEPGTFKNGILCQDIQRTTFHDNSFDLIITEDVLEHVPAPERAFNEIRRILRPGGYHISTIPVSWDQEVSFARAKLKDGDVVHLVEPEYHGDPFRPEGVLAFTTYGRDIVERFCSLIGPSEILSAHGDKFYESVFAIYNSWVFVSRKIG
ncbi:class I SAM-dependent methyltransferase [Rhodopseudomonas palustris]|uniref:Methyltransferase domain-containing protein n=1 Tax=Rhodopseudomonas palustris TaxID=1076 RepID=A0A418VE50_RHOPL|nr:class I SAM-dependent methyltransferase [Rhodopseudomonas palustris]RJF74369.1 methyltransferase domain-containing protein [Rhodopseudomonas palustris]